MMSVAYASFGAEKPKKKRKWFVIKIDHII